MMRRMKSKRLRSEEMLRIIAEVHMERAGRPCFGQDGAEGHDLTWEAGVSRRGVLHVPALVTLEGKRESARRTLRKPRAVSGPSPWP